jgi:Double-GTPase 2
MAGKCSQKDCYDPDRVGCNIEGCLILTDCKYYGKDESKTENPEQDDDVVFRIPWTGNSFGLSDLNYLSASSKPILIGITGVANAGKTAFLASLYCLLRHGHTIGKYSFTGSLTLIGWEDIAWFLSWKHNGDIQFPPHTTNNAGRVPGLLHLALKNVKGEKKDLIFTDAPGEWFDYWRNNIDSENAKGAKWIHENCNSFLLFADSDELSGNNRGKARQQITSVADRLFENIEDRPIGLIWSKSDISIKDSMKQQILSHLNQNPIVHFNEFETSVKEGDSGIFHKNILDSINWIIEKLQSNINTKPAFISLREDDMFLSKRIING